MKIYFWIDVTEIRYDLSPLNTSKLL